MVRQVGRPPPVLFGADDGNRTRVFSLGSFSGGVPRHVATARPPSEPALTRPIRPGGTSLPLVRQAQSGGSSEVSSNGRSCEPGIAPIRCDLDSSVASVLHAPVNGSVKVSISWGNSADENSGLSCCCGSRRRCTFSTNNSRYHADPARIVQRERIRERGRGLHPPPQRRFVRRHRTM